MQSVFMCLIWSWNNQRLFPYTALTDCYNWRGVFTVRYDLYLDIIPVKFNQTLCGQQTEILRNNEYENCRNIQQREAHHRIFFLWRCGPTWAMTLFLRFLDHTKRRITVGRTPLDGWSERRTDLYLTTLTTDRHPCPRWDSNPYQQASDRIPTP